MLEDSGFGYIQGIESTDTFYNYLATAFYGGAISPVAVYMVQTSLLTFNQSLANSSISDPPSAFSNATTLPFLKNLGLNNPQNRFEY